MLSTTRVAQAKLIYDSRIGSVVGRPTNFTAPGIADFAGRMFGWRNVTAPAIADTMLVERVSAMEEELSRTSLSKHSDEPNSTHSWREERRAIRAKIGGVRTSISIKDGKLDGRPEDVIDQFIDAATFASLSLPGGALRSTTGEFSTPPDFKSVENWEEFWESDHLEWVAFNQREDRIKDMGNLLRSMVLQAGVQTGHIELSLSRGTAEPRIPDDSPDRTSPPPTTMQILMGGVEDYGDGKRREPDDVFYAALYDTLVDASPPAS